MVSSATPPSDSDATKGDQTQISATVSLGTKEKLDRFCERHGLKKNFVVEQALLYYIESRRQLPNEAFIPSRLVLEDEAFARVVERVERAAAPTDRLRALMRDR